MKIKIVNHKKFRSRLIIFTFILFGILFAVKNTVSSESIVEYKTVTVNTGDTLWSIAEYEQNENSYYKNQEIRKIVSDIKKINNLESSNLSVKQNLKIPTNVQ